MAATQRNALNWGEWLGSAPGRYMVDWEQRQFDAAVGDVFGYFSVQLGFGHIDGLRCNRMPSRVLAFARSEPGTDEAFGVGTARGERTGLAGLALADPPTDDVAAVEAACGGRSRVIVDRFEELPFAEQSVDLVVLPHVLEFAEDAHQVLREVDRILRPEGRVIVSGLNPLSLWGARQLIPAGIARPFLPRQGQFIGLPRLRDWFRLLSFEIEVGRYGCYRPPCATSAWLERTAFMERAGDRWWPICGAVYLFGAVKRVRGMRLIGPAWKSVKASRAAAAVASPQFDASDRGGAHRSAVTLRTPDT